VALDIDCAGFRLRRAFGSDSSSHAPSCSDFGFDVGPGFFGSSSGYVQDTCQTPAQREALLHSAVGAIDAGLEIRRQRWERLIAAQRPSIRRRIFGVRCSIPPFFYEQLELTAEARSGRSR
jgi:hypothetical protein